jgi:hypothetical protein
MLRQGWRSCKSGFQHHRLHKSDEASRNYVLGCITWRICAFGGDWAEQLFVVNCMLQVHAATKPCHGQMSLHPSCTQLLYCCTAGMPMLTFVCFPSIAD